MAPPDPADDPRVNESYNELCRIAQAGRPKNSDVDSFSIAILRHEKTPSKDNFLWFMVKPVRPFLTTQY
jgi:hypothetical protein